eukprot:CAMPEP_0113681100 /NCGR_PEP_ID=MMETSP0038_2-20120614/11767_1 /TAXON_ID=2898 /ORGANISM="Cryptomonas paramecium" /LENGTH=37 /DNA_ID=CAMNT_0000599715 /DNA_START=128 /DNA_END=237 /DNA_ORIENTATION=+ /assembly_acc=CAM_ASM_000170
MARKTFSQTMAGDVVKGLRHTFHGAQLGGPNQIAVAA